MPKPSQIELGDGTLIPILYEDRSVLAIDKPPGWMLVPHTWQKTDRNLQSAIVSAIGEGHFWARSRNLKFLRYVHRLDADTTGILLFAKSLGAVETYGDLFESRKMEKTYLAVVDGLPRESTWTCRLSIGPDPREFGRMKIDEREGKVAETSFKVLQRGPATALLEAHPITGRTHQIRLHAAAAGLPICGDPVYGKKSRKPASSSEPAPRRRGRVEPEPMALRAVTLSYLDPFTKRPIHIQAPRDAFLRDFGFSPPPVEPKSRQGEAPAER